MSAMLKIISNSLRIQRNVLNTSHFTGENVQSFKDVLSYSGYFLYDKPHCHLDIKAYF